METTQKIDYSKFKCDVYTPDGVLIKEAITNSNHIFYCPALTVGQQYNIVFSYGEMFLMAAAFISQSEGKVTFLNPAHFLYNCAVVRPSKSFVNSVKGKIKSSRIANVPIQQWEKKLLEIINCSGQKIPPLCQNSHGTYIFKAGAELASKVK
ncbi:MAG: hypothetical protein WCK02_07615 [Bacteroidota bacterium]